MKASAILGAAVLLALATPAGAQALRVFAIGAIAEPVREAGAGFTRETGKPVEIVSGPSTVMQKRLEAGEKADLVVISTAAIEALQKQGLVLGPGRIDLARGLIGIGVRAGARKPDLSSPDTVKAALLAAKSVAYTDPAAGGATGVFYEGVTARLGIAEVMKPKAVLRSQGSGVAAAVAAGEAELGVTFTSELATTPGVEVAGPLPPAIQAPTVYTAAIAASASDPDGARALLRTLSGAEGSAAIRKVGLEALVK